MKKAPLGFEKWTTKLVENLASHFDLAGWSLHVEFPKEQKETDYAENIINCTYLYSTIRFYPPAKKDFRDGHTNRLVTAAVHEIASHILAPRPVPGLYKPLPVVIHNPRFYGNHRTADAKADDGFPQDPP